MRPYLTAAVVLSLTPLAGADGDGKRDLELLQGTWMHKSLQEDPKVKRAGREFTLVEITKKDEMAITFENNKTLTPKFTLDTAKQPRWITFTFDESGRKDKLWKGIYKIDGATLTLCFPVEPDLDNRPSEFSTPAGSGLRLVVLKRVKN